MTTIAGRFGEVAGETGLSAFAVQGYLANPCLALSAPLDPAGYAVFEGDLFAAVYGARGLLAASALCAALDGELRAAALAYSGADRLDTALHDEVLGAARMVPAFAAGALTLARTHDPVQAAQAVVAADPETADLVISALGLPTVLRTIAHDVPDGHGVVRATGADQGGVAGRPPRTLPDLLRDLARRNADDRHGEIDVRILTLPDGTRRAIVDITGTKCWTPLPTPDVTSLTTNGRALAGEQTAYEQGVLAAMHRAGVRAGDEVLLIGHSEGGMVAVNAARDATARGEFTVTHVITAGAPLGLIASSLPGSVRVLALENSRDLVPHLDGVENPDRINVTTATGSYGDGSIVGDHAIRAAYLPIAEDVQTSGNRSLRDFLTSAAGFFRARSVTTHTFQIERGP
jgi:hypothetical protein